jgi:hypothetical protein
MNRSLDEMMTESLVLRDWPLNIDIDMVLRGQGADASVLRQRRPQLIDIAQRALEDGQPLIKPAVVYRHLPVASVHHENLVLKNGAVLKGELLAQHLAPAEQIIVLVCTIGPALEQYVAEVLSTDPAYGLAVDSFGSTAVEALSVAACTYFEDQARRRSLYTSIPLSPGMIGWPVGEGQFKIFNLLAANLIGVTLSEYALMIPAKTISMVLGLSHTLFTAGRTCDFCALRATCRYQDHYAPAAADVPSSKLNG